MITLLGLSNQQFAVLGLGRTGMATALALEASGAKVWGWDDTEKSRQIAAEKGISLCDLESKPDWENISCLIVSPGIPHLYPNPHPVVEKALYAGVRIDNDIGLFFASLKQVDYRPTIVAVTGSNGKSTTAALVHSTLQSAGWLSRLVGNIGEAVLAGEPFLQNEVIVLELSSYQTDLANTLDPDVAVLLNLTEEHLDRHGGLGGYFAAKRRLFASPQTKNYVIGVDEQEGRFLAAQLEPSKVYRIAARHDHDLSSFANSVFSINNQLMHRSEGKTFPAIDLTLNYGLSGEHNQQNACAAFAACLALGLPALSIIKGFKEFTGLPHRCQIIGELNGILCVNDSKATSAVSTEMALQRFPRIHWIAGGLAKDGGITSLSQKLQNVHRVYLVGQSTQQFSAQLHDFPHIVCGTIQQAVKMAKAEAKVGDTLLLSPAAASFDQFRDFEDRGDYFVEEVRRQFAES